MIYAKDQHMKVPVFFALGAVVICLLIYRFGNYREEQLVKRFLEALRSGDYPKAYEVWGPSKEYKFADFMADWGGRGYYGKVAGFKILQSKTRGSGVIVTVGFSHLKKPVHIWVERKTHTLGFSPIEIEN